MSVDAVTLMVILAMALATYATRAGGFFIVRRLRMGPFMKAWMGHVPGAIFMALVTPAVIGAGPAGWAGAAVVVLSAYKGLPLVITLGLGVGLVALLRLSGGL